jgi:cell division transport system permease protein
MVDTMRTRALPVTVAFLLVAGAAALLTMAVVWAGGGGPVSRVRAVAPSLGTRNQVTVFLRTDVTEDQRQAVEGILRSLPSVATVRFESQQEAYETFKRDFKDAPDLVAATKPESLPPSFRITVKSPAGYCEVLTHVGNKPGVDAVLTFPNANRAC